MRLHRFYTAESLDKNLIYKNTDHLHQWKNVFRYKSGDNIILFGDGYEHIYEIKEILKKEACLQEISKTKSIAQEQEMTLVMSLIKKESFELVLQKGTEIGVTKFVPLITERSLQKIYNTERLGKILTEAAEQSGWGFVPEISSPIKYEDYINKTDCVLIDFSGKNITGNDKNKIKNILIGPEGGFSEKEILLAKKYKVNIIKLNTGILRAETAAIVMAGIIKNTQ